MLKTDKPDVFDFFVRGWPLEHALAIRERWDSLTELARAAARIRWDRLTVGDARALGLFEDHDGRARITRPAGARLH
jgi:hypothetical protein